jgi:hypothetical protein
MIEPQLLVQFPRRFLNRRALVSVAVELLQVTGQEVQYLVNSLP